MATRADAGKGGDDLSRDNHQRGCRRPEGEPGDDLSSARPWLSGREAQRCVSPIARSADKKGVASPIDLDCGEPAVSHHRLPEGRYHPSLGASDDEMNLTAAATGAHKPIAPFDVGHVGLEKTFAGAQGNDQVAP
jgi:hypothetical protein